MKKWNWNDITPFATWMSEEVAYKVLAEFYHWYKQEVSKMETDEQMTKLHERGFEDLPLPTLDEVFTICGKEFEVRDALYLATWELGVIAKDLPDNPDGWLNKDCTKGVRAFAEGFFCGVVRGMLD